MFERILVGTDGSGTAAAAVAHAAELAKTTGGELIVVSAYQVQPDGTLPFADSAGSPGADVGRGLLEDVQKRYGGDVRLRTMLRQGHAADAIVEAAEEEHADVIVVGNRGMSGPRRFVLGSVPNAVSHHAPCHVLIVHTSDE